MNKGTEELVIQLAAQLSQNNLKVCTAESCTGGLIAKLFTDLPGSSAWFDRGMVTYSNQAKVDMLAVPESVIESYGAVSEAVVSAMATGALKNSQADFSIAVTGVAGPDGGSSEKPVGTVWIAVAGRKQVIAQKSLFTGGRDDIRQETARTSIINLLNLIKIDG